MTDQAPNPPRRRRIVVLVPLVVFGGLILLFLLRLYAGVLQSSPGIVDMVRADRWNGVLPATLLEGSSGLPLLNLSPTTADAPAKQ